MQQRVMTLRAIRHSSWRRAGSARSIRVRGRRMASSSFSRQICPRLSECQPSFGGPNPFLKCGGLLLLCEIKFNNMNSLVIYGNPILWYNSIMMMYQCNNPPKILGSRINRDRRSRTTYYICIAAYDDQCIFLVWNTAPWIILENATVAMNVACRRMNPRCKKQW